MRFTLFDVLIIGRYICQKIVSVQPLAGSRVESGCPGGRVTIGTVKAIDRACFVN